jgi:hypothetical protein
VDNVLHVLQSSQEILMCGAIMALLGYHTCYWEKVITSDCSVKDPPCFADPPSLYNAMVEQIEKMPDGFVKCAHPDSAACQLLDIRSTTILLSDGNNVNKAVGCSWFPLLARWDLAFFILSSVIV